ncbi:MAG: hypothetical protein M1831_003372 [Alyxoria varia]|nr:MAG: hypothetical protein M1831_003372 [Alyxoria varia]
MSAPSSSTNPSGAQTFPTRNPRRRQRKDIEEGGSLRSQPERKRSKLIDGSSKPHTNGDVETQTTISSNGHALSADGHKDRESSSPSARFDMPMRAKGRGLRGSKDDVSTVLTEDANFTVRRLPCLPDALRKSDVDYRGHVFPSSSRALALTRTHAYVWDCNSPYESPQTTTLALPNPSRSTQPVPVGSLVKLGSDGDTGLLVIAPTSGKITYWENIDNAEALSLFEKRRHGVEGHLGSMSSGETVTDLTSLGQAGFVVIMNTGRIAQILLRDSQSRAAISVTPLRNPNANTGGGIFGMFKGAFGTNGWLKDVCAVRARPSKTRGHVNVLAASESGTLQLWQLNWSGNAQFVGEINAMGHVQAVAHRTLGNDTEAEFLESTLVDIALKSEAVESRAIVSNSTADYHFDVLALVEFKSANSKSFALAEIEIESNHVTVSRLTPVRSYAARLKPTSHWRPRVILPSPFKTAFVVFENAITIASIQQPPNGDSRPFQDTLYLQDDRKLNILGIAADSTSKSRHNTISSAIVYVQDQGILKVTPAGQENFSNVTAKDKIEQAISFGSAPHTPLRLGNLDEYGFSVDDVQNAATSISGDILSSKFRHLQANAVSMENNLQKRAKLLRSLARVVTTCCAGLSRNTRWTLRFDAEKLAAARGILLRYEENMKENPSRIHVLPSLILDIPPHAKSLPDGKTCFDEDYDQVRSWFQKDVSEINTLMGFTMTEWQQLFRFRLEDASEWYGRTWVVLDCVELISVSLETGFAFREESAPLYGLEDEVTQDGLLLKNYSELSRFWTSSLSVLIKTRDLILKAAEFLTFLLEEDGFPEAQELGLRISTALPRTIALWNRAVEECVGWLRFDTEKYRREAEPVMKNFQKDRRKMLGHLPCLNETPRGLALAEQFQDMGALVLVLREEANIVIAKGQVAHSRGPVRDAATDEQRRQEQEAAAEASQRLDATIGRCVNKYGLKFVEPWFSRYIQHKDFEKLLEQAKIYKQVLAQYLRANPSRRKLSFLNDILSERDYSTAGSTLLHASHAEPTSWNKKIELSMAKLTLLAANEDSRDESIDHFAVAGESHNAAIQISKIQERLADHMQPTFYEATDEDAMLQLAMQDYGNNVKPYDKLQELLRNDFEMLIARNALNPEQLIDILTLMDPRPCDQSSWDISLHRYFLALRVAKYARKNMGEMRFDIVVKTIWRRCYINEQWDVIDKTQGKSDAMVMEEISSTTLFMTFFEGYQIDFFESPSPFTIPKPSTLLVAGTATEDHMHRYRNADISAAIARDTEREVEALESCIENYRLEHWVEIARDGAGKLMAKQKGEKLAKNIKVVTLMQAAGEMERQELKKEVLGFQKQSAAEGSIASAANRRNSSRRQRVNGNPSGSRHRMGYYDYDEESVEPVDVPGLMEDRGSEPLEDGRGYQARRNSDKEARNASRPRSSAARNRSAASASRTAQAPAAATEPPHYTTTGIVPETAQEPAVTVTQPAPEAPDTGRERTSSAGPVRFGGGPGAGAGANGTPELDDDSEQGSLASQEENVNGVVDLTGEDNEPEEMEEDTVQVNDLQQPELPSSEVERVPSPEKARDETAQRSQSRGEEADEESEGADDENNGEDVTMRDESFDEEDEFAQEPSDDDGLAAGLAANVEEADSFVSGDELEGDGEEEGGESAEASVQQSVEESEEEEEEGEYGEDRHEGNSADEDEEFEVSEVEPDPGENVRQSVEVGASGRESGTSDEDDEDEDAESEEAEGEDEAQGDDVVDSEDSAGFKHMGSLKDSRLGPFFSEDDAEEGEGESEEVSGESEIQNGDELELNMEEQ